MGIKPGIPSYGTGKKGLRDLLCQMKEDKVLTAAIPELLAMGPSLDGTKWEALQKTCPTLKAKSLSAFSRAPKGEKKVRAKGPSASEH